MSSFPARLLQRLNANRKFVILLIVLCLPAVAPAQGSGRESTGTGGNHIGVSDSFHPVSHHANDLTRIEKLIKIQTWHVERFAAFLGKLAKVQDGEGTLLDHAMFLYGSNMSNSDRHNGHPLPTILVGGANGKLRGSQHIELSEPTPLANLHLTILDTINARQDSFGDSTGRLAGLEG